MANYTVRQFNGRVRSVETERSPGEAAQILRGLPSQSSFVRDLVSQYDRYGEGMYQLGWLMVVAEESRQRSEPSPVVSDFGRVLGLFQTALEAGLRHPKVRLATADGQPVVLSLCGERSKYAGSVQVTSGHRYGDPAGTYYGRINPDGTFTGRDQEVLSVLRSFGEAPESVAASYGKMTNCCCFCGRDLSNSAAGSVAVGYGPICAGKFGLPWQPNAKEYAFREGNPVVAAEAVA